MNPFSAVCLLACIAIIPAHARADAREEVQRSLEQVVAAGGFVAHANGHVFGPGLPAMSGDIEVVFPDRIHARTDELEFVLLPGGAWLSAFGVWTPTDPSMLPVTTFDPAAMRKAIASIRDVREEGTSTTSQCKSRVYRFRASGQLPGAQTDGDARLWVCDGSGRPARLEASDAAGGDRLSIEFDWSRRAHVEAPSN
ncbi:MAG: hypothetical protein ACREPX_02190 [Rhodanobacteraceae bacterium]